MALEKFELALEVALKALKFRIEDGRHRNTVRARLLVGKLYRLMNELDKALKVQNEIINERREHGLEPSGYVHEELAEIYSALGKKSKALEHVKIALELLEKDVRFMTFEKQRHGRLFELLS